jgi:regulator of cell morphogenesis and NO signaling
MTTVAPDLPLALLVTENLARARVLDAYGLNYYSRGSRSLEVACREGGLSREEVSAAIAQADGWQREWMPNLALASIAAVTAHVEESHHRYLRTVLPKVDYLLDAVESAHGEVHPELVAVATVFRRFRSGIEAHMSQEETIFFPRCREFERTGDPRIREALSSYLGIHEAAHLDAEQELQTIRRLTHDFRVPQEACPSYARMFELLLELEADMHLHLHKENNILFRRLRSPRTVGD